MQPIEIHDRGRGPELKGTRITVYDVVPYHLHGDSADEIAKILRVPVEGVEALLSYFAEHRDEVMAWHNTIEERIARGHPPEVESRLASIRGSARRLMEEMRRRKAEANGDGHPG